MDLGALAVIAVVSAAWLAVATGGLSVAAALALIALPIILWRAGWLVSGVLGVASFFALELLLGVIVVGASLTLWKLFLPWSLSAGLIVLLVLIVGLPRFLPPPQREPASMRDFLVVVVALAAATGWSQGVLRPVAVVGGGFVFKPWSDFFWHASIVARMTEGQSLLKLGSYEWQGLPALPYHYASYVFPALLSELGRLPAYDAVTAFWTPFGSFLAGLAAYALGRSLWGHEAGLASVVATELLPDASMVGVGHPVYGYFWIQHVAPAGLYGVAVGATALILVALGTRHRRVDWTAAGLAGGLVVIVFKTHVFAAAFPLLIIFAFVTWPAPKGIRLLAFGLCLASALAVYLAARWYGIGPDIRLDGSGATWYWPILAKVATIEPVRSWFAIFTLEPLFPTHLIRAACLLLISALGLSVVLVPAALLLAGWRGERQALDWLPMGAIGILLLLAFGLNRDKYWSGGDELLHRPFVWAFFVAGALSSARLVDLTRWKMSSVSQWIVGPGFLLLLLVPAYCGVDLQRGKNALWMENFLNLRVDRGLVDCARFIRSSVPVDAVIQDSRLDGDFLILGALSERHSYAARPVFWNRTSKSFRESNYRENLNRLARLQEAATLADLQDSVRETRIHWYVAHPGDALPWPEAVRDHPVFESGGYKVFDLNAQSAGE